MSMNFKYREELLGNLLDLIAIPSVNTEEARTEMPFGKEVANALNRFLEIAGGLGFETKNFDGYVGEVNVGKGNYIIGVLCHIDVVEAGKGWDSEPFLPHIKDNKVYGRGSSDNKGPMLTALYAIKRLHDDGKIPDDVTIRMIIGTNEEEMWEDIKYYLKIADSLPNISIVPDGYFPLVYCEKGLYDFDIIHDLSDNEMAAVKIIELHGGDARNVVPAEAISILKADDFIVDTLQKALVEKGYDGEVRNEGNNVKVKIIGKSCHAMVPEKGINAISQMIDILSVCCKQRFITDFNRLIGTSYNGEKCGCAFEDVETGALTFNVGMISILDGKILLKANLRYPPSQDFDTLNKVLIKSMGKGNFKVEFVEHLLPIYLDKDGKLINILMKAYQDISGDTKTEPLAIGGATYARALPNAVCFGTLFPYEEELAHEVNEFIDIDSIGKAMDILYEALLLLMEEKI